MDATAVTRLVARLAELAGARIRAVREFGPVVDVELERQRTRRHLAVVTRHPGPWALVLDESPFAGMLAPERLVRIRGYRVTHVARPGGDRVVDLSLSSPDGDDGWTLRIGLYGARAGLVVLRGEREIERLGAAVHVRPRDADAPPTAAAPVRVDSGEPGASAVEAASSSVPSDPEPASVHEAARVLEAARAEMRRALARPLRRHARRLRRLCEHLERDARTAAGHERVRREAETLAANRWRLERGARRVRLADVHDPDVELDIELDPAEPVQAQIDARFRRARRLERRLEHATRRLELARRELSEVEAAADAIEAAAGVREAARLAEAARVHFGLDGGSHDTGDAHRPGGAGGARGGGHRGAGRDARAGEARPHGTAPRGRASATGRRTRTGERHGRAHAFRRFDLGGGWFALVGRDDRANDELTFHHAAPDDVWLHAQGVPGSHVVLKGSAGSGNPPRSVLERAASIAAHFSRARHSSLVPVIWTRRRYVRKFRGARPGQVRCEREKTLVVPPELPPSAPDAP